MSKLNLSNTILAVLSAISLAGCSSVHEGQGTQGAVVTGKGGAAAIAPAPAEHRRLLGSLQDIGTAGTYIVGASSDRILSRDQNGAEEAARRSQEHPATAQEALHGITADLNGDGFVTLDEIIAMNDAELTAAQILDRMQASGQVFEVTPDQRQYLLSRGVSPFVVDQMERVNRVTRDRLLSGSPIPSARTWTPPVVTPQVTIPPLNVRPDLAPPGVGQPPIIQTE
jgi:hypothetical protein